MSSLWSGNNTKLSKNQANPSPICDDNFLDAAQGIGDFANSTYNLFSKAPRFIEKRSLLTSKGFFCAGMTVEAALVLPLFLFFLLNIGSVIEMIRLHGNMQLALWEVGNQTAVYAYAVENGVHPEEMEESHTSNRWEEFAGTALTSFFFRWMLVETVGENYLENSPMVGGDEGIVLWESDIVKPNGEMDIVVTYGAAPPFAVPGVPYFRMVNRYYGHAWTGYEPEEQEEQEVEMVFITDNAEVYHLYRDCTHLLLTIRKIPMEALKDARNLYGGRYSACEKCAEGRMPAGLFIAMEGDRYHYVRECPGLKRTIYVISVQDVKELPLCSRCGTREERKSDELVLDGMDGVDECEGR